LGDREEIKQILLYSSSHDKVDRRRWQSEFTLLFFTYRLFDDHVRLR
jgi:hypothetical protein